MPYPSEAFTMEENTEREFEDSYMETLVEARIENAIVTYDYAPVMTDVETNEEIPAPEEREEFWALCC